MSVWWQLAIGIVALGLVLRFVLSRVSSREPAESSEPPPKGQPLAGVPSPKRRDPQNRSGAVALAEPDDDDEYRSYPPRHL